MTTNRFADRVENLTFVKVKEHLKRSLPDMSL